MKVLWVPFYYTTRYDCAVQDVFISTAYVYSHNEEKEGVVLFTEYTRHNDFIFKL